MIELYRIEKRYPGDVLALVDVNFVVGKGEFVFLTGPSGAGKSTLLRLIMAAEEPTHGQVIVAGRNLARVDRRGIPYLRRNLGVIFQDFKLLPTRTAFENVALALEVQGLPAREVRDRVEGILDRVSLLHRARAYPPQLSGGEQQRVAIARALVGEPAVLLADEPTGNLDPELTVEVMDLLTSFSARGTTVLVATHDTSLLDRYRKRVVRLDKGRIQEERR